MSLESMSDFFTARVEEYDDHMLNDVEGCREAYAEMAELLPGGVRTVLDLGCGTGLELEGIFARFPDIAITGIDLTQAMLDKLAKKYSDREINLICGDYFAVDFGISAFDAAISFQTMHHFSHEEKRRLYTKIRKALKPGGVYIECDYMVVTQEEEDMWFSENRRLRAEQGVPNGEFYHYDTPCTIENQIELFLRAGFTEAAQVWRQENTTIIVAGTLWHPQPANL